MLWDFAASTVGRLTCIEDQPTGLDYFVAEVCGVMAMSAPDLAAIVSQLSTVVTDSEKRTSDRLLASEKRSNDMVVRALF